MTGIHWLTESGFLPSPILITNTNSIGLCRDSLIKWFLKKNNSISMIDNLVHWFKREMSEVELAWLRLVLKQEQKQVHDSSKV
jgi:hypothetical protein